MISPITKYHFKLSLVFFTITGELALLAFSTSLSNSGRNQSFPITLRRKSRNVAQLGRLLEENTHYQAADFVFYGNWCGFGGNRAGDGSVLDACDACCKAHDACYSVLLYWVRGDKPPAAYSLEGDTTFFRSSPKYPNTLPLRKCIPYTDIYVISSSQHCMNFGGYCSRKTCECDRDFVNCLKRTRCGMRSGRNSWGK